MLHLGAEMSGVALPGETEPAEHAMLDVHEESEPVVHDSYEDDTFDDMDPEEAVDVALNSIYEADAFEAAEEADRSAAENAGMVMPERPVSPVAMQLAVAAGAGATIAAVSALHDKSAPASLVGDQAVIDDQNGGNDTYDDDVFEGATAAQTDAKSEDGLVSSALQPAGGEDVGSEAGSAGSSDLDDVTQADAEQVAGAQADESHQNHVFGMTAEPSGAQTEDSQAQPSGETSSSGDQTGPHALAAHDSAAQYSKAQALTAQDSEAVASAPQPPPQRSLGEVRRPARPSRAFIRHTISLTREDSGAGPLTASPLPAAPQAPAGPPPRHRWVCLLFTGLAPLLRALCPSWSACVTSHFGSWPMHARLESCVQASM